MSGVMCQNLWLTQRKRNGDVGGTVKDRIPQKENQGTIRVGSTRYTRGTWFY